MIFTRCFNVSGEISSSFRLFRICPIQINSLFVLISDLMPSSFMAKGMFSLIISPRCSFSTKESFLAQHTFRTQFVRSLRSAESHSAISTANETLTGLPTIAVFDPASWNTWMEHGALQIRDKKIGFSSTMFFRHDRGISKMPWRTRQFAGNIGPPVSCAFSGSEPGMSLLHLNLVMVASLWQISGNRFSLGRRIGNLALTPLETLSVFISRWGKPMEELSALDKMIEEDDSLVTDIIKATISLQT
mmetsp:Transcript_21235/g.44673  ORF Transcript_21235/g.44673 Transcript_21235/m.44673 type:complete len:246 (+) Transcript_21235:1818-2555(+)